MSKPSSNLPVIIIGFLLLAVAFIFVSNMGQDASQDNITAEAPADDAFERARQAAGEAVDKAQEAAGQAAEGAAEVAKDAVKSDTISPEAQGELAPAAGKPEPAKQ